MKQRPVAIDLLPCEQVIIEEKTGNVTPVNCFTHRTVARFPSETFPFVVFAVLTDGSGTISMEVLIQRLDTLDEVYRRAFPSNLPVPSGTSAVFSASETVRFPCPDSIK
jgi:hypothetical protein